MKNFSLILVLATILFSCSPKLIPVAPQSRYFDDFPLNENLNAELGDRLVLTGNEIFQKGLIITSETDFKISMYSYGLQKGDEVTYKYKTNEWDVYLDEQNLWGVVIDVNNPNNIQPCVFDNMMGAVPRKIENFTVEPTTIVDKNCSSCFKQEFIYNGKANNSIKFIYREYVRDMARPAFNQELQYDLNESKIIGFKGLRIEIIEATNTNISYKILSNFNKE